jgi:uncharacterized small protein (DUF1192 family)
MKKRYKPKKEDIERLKAFLKKQKQNNGKADSKHRGGSQ